MAFFELLTGGPRTDFPLASVKDISAGADAASEALYSYSRVWLEYLGARSGYFALQNNMIQENHNEHLALFRRHEIAAVLSMTAPGGNVANSCLLPLRDIPAGNSELVYVEDSGMGDPRSIGTIYQLQPNVAVFKISLPSPFAVSCTQNLRGMAVGDGHLMLNGNTVARITDNQIEPEHGSMLKLSDSGEHLASIDSLTTPGIMEIVLEHDDGARLRRPFLEVHRQPSGVYLDIKQPLKNVIGIAPDE